MKENARIQWISGGCCIRGLTEKMKTYALPSNRKKDLLLDLNMKFPLLPGWQFQLREMSLVRFEPATGWSRFEALCFKPAPILGKGHFLISPRGVSGIIKCQIRSPLCDKNEFVAYDGQSSDHPQKLTF